MSAAPSWCLEPQEWFPCPSCGDGLYWDDLAHGELLVCANSQCFTVGTPVPIWLAQQHREDRGMDEPVSGPGWPRPVLDGRPVPFLTPVTAGHPWWTLTHGPRLLKCQNDWCCQVCGERLNPQAWVLVDAFGAMDSDAALHERCLRLAVAACPHLVAEASGLEAVRVHRGRIHGDGKPLSDGGAWTRQQWTVPNLRAQPICSRAGLWPAPDVRAGAGEVLA